MLCKSRKFTIQVFFCTALAVADLFIFSACAEVPADSHGNSSLLHVPAAADDLSPEKTPGLASRLYSSFSDSIAISSKRLGTYASQTYGSLEIMVEGMKLLTPGEFESLIPKSKSYFWWLNNRDVVIASLKQNPIVQDVQINNCPPEKPYRCFKLSLKERNPNLWVRAALGNNQGNDQEVRFLISDDGAVLAILTEQNELMAMSKFDRKLLARFAPEVLTSLPVLDARNLANVSDASQQLFARAVNLISAIERESGFKVYEFRFVGEDQLEVEFDSQPYKLVFNVEAIGSINARIAVQLNRLNRILIATPQLASRAVTINLGLDKEAFAVLVRS